MFLELFRARLRGEPIGALLRRHGIVGLAPAGGVVEAAAVALQLTIDA